MPGHNTTEDFWARVHKTRTCWLWRGWTDAGGYGVFYSGPRWLAHRFAYIITHGSIPKGMHILHHCDVRNCVRPDHFYAGTNADNMRDRKERGKYAGLNGEQNVMAKLTEKKVLEIRASSAMGVTLAARYGVSAAQISLIRKRGNWKHI